jgi:phospholipid/cholesterol/gamma-HCH transport system ATP-binding protein
VLDKVTGEMEGNHRTFLMDFRIMAGEFVLVIGPTRSGKSLLVELCAGLLRPESGRVIVFGSDWAELSDVEQTTMRLRIGTVLQQPGLLNNMTVYNNVALPLRYHRSGVGEMERHTAVMAELEAFRLTGVRDRFPAQLTLGEARCAAIARAMVLNPDMLLLDDVAGGLDADMLSLLTLYLDECRRKRAVTIVATLRMSSSLLERADRVALLRGGRLDAIGSRETVLQEAAASMKTYLI